jgi:hypothetical protein
MMWEELCRMDEFEVKRSDAAPAAQFKYGMETRGAATITHGRQVVCKMCKNHIDGGHLSRTFSGIKIFDCSTSSKDPIVRFYCCMGCREDHILQRMEKERQHLAQLQVDRLAKKQNLRGGTCLLLSEKTTVPPHAIRNKFKFAK